MKIVVAYKWAPNPQDLEVRADGTVDASRGKPTVSEYDPVAFELARRLADETGGEVVGLTVGAAAIDTPLARKAALSRGLDRLAGVIATKPASAHVGAAEECLRQFRPGALVDAPGPARSPFRRELHECAVQAGTPLRLVAAGDMLELGAGARLHVLHPPAVRPGPRREDQPLVLRLDCADGRGAAQAGSAVRCSLRSKSMPKVA